MPHVVWGRCVVLNQFGIRLGGAHFANCDIPSAAGFTAIERKLLSRRQLIMERKFAGKGLVVALLFAGASPAMMRAQTTQDAGQEQAAPAQNAPARPDLNLTDDQKAQMKKIHENAKSQMDAVNSDSSLSADQKGEKLRQIHRDTHKQMQAILTPEQRQTMKEWRRSHRGQGQQAPSGN
jgi:protein CpxP